MEADIGIYKRAKKAKRFDPDKGQRICQILDSLKSEKKPTLNNDSTTSNKDEISSKGFWQRLIPK